MTNSSFPTIKWYKPSQIQFEIGDFQQLICFYNEFFFLISSIKTTFIDSILTSTKPLKLAQEALHKPQPKSTQLRSSIWKKTEATVQISR